SSRSGPPWEAHRPLRNVAVQPAANLDQSTHVSRPFRVFMQLGLHGIHSKATDPG
ncbi:Hypothetical predicted protein, partial [Olea europaea subsp. europaea]